jgi:hypothetical protein
MGWQIGTQTKASPKWTHAMGLCQWGGLIQRGTMLCQNGLV